MKRPIFKITVVLFMMLPLFVLSQSEQVSKIFDKFSEVDGFTSVDISKGLFELFSEIEADDPDFDDFKKAIEGLESFKLLAYSMEDGQGDMNVRNEFVDEIRNTISFKDYQELMVVKDKDAKINFYAKSEKQIITEMIMVVDGNDKAVLLSVYGNLDLNYMAKLGKGMNMGGMEYLEKMHGE